MDNHPLLDRIPTLPRPRPRGWMRFGVWTVTFVGMSLLCVFTIALLAALRFAVLAAAVLLCFFVTDGFFGLGDGPVLSWLLGGCLLFVLYTVGRNIYAYATCDCEEDETESFEAIDDPFLNELAARLCERFDTPRPTAIVVTADLGARVFRSGERAFSIAIDPSLFTRFRTNDLAFLLAHEIAHFPEVVQRRHLLLWKIKCYLEGLLEAYFGADANSPDRSYGTILPNLERLTDRLFRLPGNSLFQLQTFLFAWFRRAHESEADRLAVQLLGRRVSGSAMRRMAFGGADDNDAQAIIIDYFRAGWRIVDVGKLRAEHSKKLALDRKLARALRSYSPNIIRTVWDATRPCLLAELRLARRGPDVDLPASEETVSELIADFAAIDSAASAAFYRSWGLRGFETLPVCDGATLVEDYAHAREACGKFVQFFPGGLPDSGAWIDLFDGPIGVDSTESVIAARIVEARRAMKDLTGLFEERLEQWEAKRGPDYEAISEWLSGKRAGCPVAVLRRDTQDRKGRPHHALSAVSEAMAAAEKTMQPYTDAAMDRLRCMLLLLGREEFRKRLSGGEELYARCLRVRPIVLALVRMRAAAETLDWVGQPLCWASANGRWKGWRREKGQRMPDGSVPFLESLRTAFKTMQAAGRDVPCHLLDGTGTVTLAEYLTAPLAATGDDDEDSAASAGLPEEGSAEALFDELLLMFDNPFSVRCRYGEALSTAFGELVIAAEAVETALGLPPLEPWDPS